MSKGYELADGSLSTDYEIGDEFVITGNNRGAISKIGDTVFLPEMTVAIARGLAKAEENV